LKNGDIINIDVTVIKDGYHGDTSMMFCVGDKVPTHAIRLCNVARECLWLGIEQVKPGNTLYDIAKAIETHAHRQGYSVVEEYCGHGIGKQFHEEPQVLHYADPSLKSITLVPGMTFTIEPMINQGRKETKVLGDKWTVVTKDRKLSAQWEHTLAVTEEGYEIFTLRHNETPFLPNRHESD
jgi:methionyl aminopeptidase